MESRGTVTDDSHEFLKMVKTAPVEVKPQLFQRLLTKYGIIPPNDSKRLPESEMDLSVFDGKFPTVVDIKVQTIFISAQAYYKNSLQISNEIIDLLNQFYACEEQVFVLSRVLESRFIPMLEDDQLKGAVRMTDDCYNRFGEIYKDKVFLLESICKGAFKEWSEMAAALWTALGFENNFKDIPWEEKVFLFRNAMTPAPIEGFPTNFPSFPLELTEDDFERANNLKEIIEIKELYFKLFVKDSITNQKTESFGIILRKLLEIEDFKTRIIALIFMLKQLYDPILKNALIGGFVRDLGGVLSGEECNCPECQAARAKKQEIFPGSIPFTEKPPQCLGKDCSTCNDRSCSFHPINKEN